MNPFVISTDTGADLPGAYCRTHEIPVLALPVTLEGVTRTDMDVREFYAQLRAGALPTTSAANLADTTELFRSILSQGQDLLHIAFSSGLSSSAGTAILAAQQVSEEFPDRTLLVVDSLCASMGEGLLVHKAVKLRDQGLSIQEVYEKTEAMKGNIVHNFTVDDLNHLHRGGRVSKATAVVGSLVGIKPVLHVDDGGHLVSISKARGRKASIQALVDRMEKQQVGFDNPEVFISHGDCPADAEYLAGLVREKFGIQDILIDYIGPTIGTHSGPGTLALFFLGSPR
jgi:DegV family protein with EDD domain